MLKTPHIGLLCLDVLDRLGIHYEVYGGPGDCCGIYQMVSGDSHNALRQGTMTYQRIAATEATQVVSWCPTCHIQFGETTLPIQQSGATAVFEMEMFVCYLTGRLEQLVPHLRHPVLKRVALHEHPGGNGVSDAVAELLKAVPGIELVPLELPQIGYTLISLARVPEHRKRLLANEFAAAEAAGVSTLAGIYHSDHRELSAHDGQWSFEVINFMEIIGESMGIVREDTFKRLKTMRNADAILADCAELIAEHNLDPEIVRDVVMTDMLGEQILPIERSDVASASE